MTVKRFECSSAERLALLLASEPGSPYRAHRNRIGKKRYDQWAAERGARLLCNATGAFEVQTGAVAWNHLPWDSDLFGFPAARIDLLIASGGYNEARATAAALIRKTIEECESAGIQHLVMRLDASSLPLAHAASENGFEWIDGIQTFSFELGADSPMPEHTRLATIADADQVAAIARSSFVYDRFHADVSIDTATADRVHESWARNSISGQAADAVLLATSGEEVDAFVTLKLDSPNRDSLGLGFAVIPLVATALAARGKGAARRATEAALNWCREQKAAIVEVGTQIANVPAARLYQSAGFRTTAISLTYRKIIHS